MGGQRVRVEFSERFNNWPSRKAWLRWVKRRGLNVNLIPLPTTMVIDYAARTVTVEQFVRTPDGASILLDESGESAQRVEVVVPFRAWAMAIPPAFA